jgi:hypothetical protein
MKTIGLIGRGLVSATMAMSCGGPDPVPDKPTWVDVQPVMRGNCFGCHGAERASLLAGRLDFYYDPADARLRDIAVGDVDNYMKGIGFLIAGGAKGDPTIAAFIGPGASDPMPPPPASMSDHDLQIIRKWADPVAGKPQGTRTPNHRPAAAWGTTLVNILVTDEDREQVLGKLTCNGVETPLTHTGLTVLPAGLRAPCTAALFDGWEVVKVNLP